MFHNNVLCVLIVVCGICLTGECGVVAPRQPFRSHITGGYKNFQVTNNASEVDCSQFSDDYDILRQFPFPVMINPSEDDLYGKSVAVMDEDGIYVNTINIYKENVVPPSIFCLSNVVDFETYETPFVNDIVPDALANWKSLKYLWIYYVPVVKMTEQLITLENLKMLVMRGCSLPHLPNLSPLKNLYWIDLPGNRLSHLDGIGDVVTLDLNGNFFKHTPAIDKGKRLSILDMGNNPLETIPPILLYNNLTLINLKNTSLTRIPPAIDKLQQLKLLDFSNNKLSQLPTNILNLPLLEEVDVSMNLFAPNEIQSIQKAFKKSLPETNLII